MVAAGAAAVVAANARRRADNAHAAYKTDVSKVLRLPEKKPFPGLEVLLSSNPTEIKGPSGQIYGATSLCCLRPADEPRRAAIRFVESRSFDPFILATIRE